MQQTNCYTTIMAFLLDNTNIVNLSSFHLTETQISVLQRGLKFCPTPGPPNPGDLRADMDRMHTRLQQIAFYNKLENALRLLNTSLGTPMPADPGDSLNPFKHRKFKLRATGKGPFGPPNLESMVLCNEQQLSHRSIFRTSHSSNITPAEFLVIKELQANNQTIIKPTAKGSSVVIWDRLGYLREGYRQLSDQKFYRKLDHNHTKSFSRVVANRVEDMFQNGEDVLLEPICRTPEFYLLLKIHKKDRPIRGRPIISSNNGPTKCISQFVDHFLSLPSNELPSFIKDTTHFLQLLENMGP